MPDSPVAPRSIAHYVSPTGCLLLHGFTSSPGEFDSLIQFLLSHNISVLAPLLPGHGTSIKDLNETTADHILQSAEHSLFQLMHQCDTVFIGGLSMGAGLALALAVKHECQGLVIISPGTRPFDWRRPLLPLLKLAFTSLPKNMRDHHRSYFSYTQTPLSAAASLIAFYKRLEQQLHCISSPVILIHSQADKTFPIRNLEFIFNYLASPEKQLCLLTHSSHVIPVSEEKNIAFAHILSFIRSQSSNNPGP